MLVERYPMCFSHATPYVPCKRQRKASRLTTSQLIACAGQGDDRKFLFVKRQENVLPFMAAHEVPEHVCRKIGFTPDTVAFGPAILRLSMSAEGISISNYHAGDRG